MLRKLFIFFFIGLFAAPCSGQTYNYLVGNNFDYAQFDAQGKLAYTEDANWDLIYTQLGGSKANIASICNSVGDMLFYTDGFAIYNNSRKIMENGDSLLAAKSRENVSVIIPATDSTYYLIYCTYKDSFSVEDYANDSTSVLYYALINVRANKGLGSVVQKNVSLMGSSYDFYGGTHCRNADGSYWYVTRNERAFYSFYVDEGGISLRDSLLYDSYSNYPDSLLNLSPDTFRSDQNHAQKFSHLGDYFLSGMHSFTGINNLSGYIFQQLELHKIRFDKATGAMRYDQPVFFKTFETTESLTTYITDFTVNVSTNDSVIYITHRNWINLDRDNSSLHLYNTSKQPLVQNVREIKKWVGEGYKGVKYNGLNIDPNGDLYMLHNGPLGPLNTRYYRTTVLNANTAPSASIKSTELSFRFITGNSFPNHLYDYLKPKPSIEYDCQAHVQMQNKSDLNGGMNSFTWYFTLEDGSIDTVIGFEPSLTYTINGDYPYKCYGYSPRAKGYGEFYVDTLKIRIPPKPVAKFIAKDTIVCAYSKATFTNKSSTDTVHTVNGEKWVWTFGDGETKTVSLPFGEGQGGANPPPGATHVYEKPGTYTVSLFFSNGFCDSTLTKNQYIKVVDAPAPGFSIDNNRGCSPFTVNVTDTVTHNTVKKKIIYGDGAIDSFFANSLPPWGRAGLGAVPHVYPNPGNYWITQRLYGYTGCVTQLDSVQIFVTPGFTEFDTSHIANATYQNVPARPKLQEVITVNWPCLLEDAAVRYHLYRNNRKIAELDAQPCVYGQMFYVDSLAQPSKSLLSYTVLAIDSCGTATQVGRVGQPVHLTGEVVGNNELSIIRYTAYQDWNVGAEELSYDLQTEDGSGNWITIKLENSTVDYRDNQFLAAKKEGIQLEKCYRVIASLGTSKASISNILCLPYSPVVFVPTGFSPNADGLNDVYRPITFGIEYYTMSIYDRYGQKIAELNQDSPGWDAADYPMGAYMVTLRAKGTDNKWYNVKETVTVVR